MEAIKVYMVPKIPKRHLCDCGRKQVSIKYWRAPHVMANIDPRYRGIVHPQWQCYCRFCGRKGPIKMTQLDATIAWNNVMDDVDECNRLLSMLPEELV